MRLLHLDHSERLVSTDFRGKTIPPYAILSHRWGDAEVLFEDLGSNTYKEKDGYRKIEFCAQQAAQDHLQYFWIDTCCIDKWNLDELSKSINSMFRWYRDAAKCYVFLTDVSVSATHISQRNAWEASFRASEWFNRGWTLQELIAPVSVEFFSCEGWRIGDKASIEQLICDITGIPLKALRNCPLDQYTISERREWARGRITTEEEDSVYCLLGILDIFMPTAYGEGKENALSRLQAEVDAINVPSIIPFSRNDHFVGREMQLAELEAKLFGSEQTTMLAISGPGGTGKTQLALELAYKTRQTIKSCSVFWVDASHIASLYQSYANIAQKLGVIGWDDEKADSKQLVKAHLSRTGTKPCLLIFDNTDNVDLGPTGSSMSPAASLMDFLPQSGLCSVILTTTNSDIAKGLALHGVVELGEMTLNAAQRMLENHLNTSIATNPLESRLLIQELSYLPLAIVQAAAYINATNVTLQEYRSRLVIQQQEALELDNRSSKDEKWDRNRKSPITTTLLISIEQIRRSDALAASYLFLAACIDRKDIPLVLLEAPFARQRDDSIKFLTSYALITRRPAESALDIHRMVHGVLRRWLQKQKLLDEWTYNALIRLINVFPNDDHSSRSKWRRLLPHAKYVLLHSVAEQQRRERLALAWKCAMTLYRDGRYNESEKLFLEVVEARKKVLGEEDPQTLTSMANLATIYRHQGRWKESEELEVFIIETRKKVLGDKHLDTLNSIANLASTYRNQGRWKEAEKQEVEVIKMRKIMLGDEHLHTLTSIANLATTYSNQGRWKEAENLEVHVVETSKRVLGDEHPNTLNSIGNLASTYRDQGQWEEAEKLELQVIEVRKRVLGEEHSSTLASMNNLAMTYRKLGRWGEAEELNLKVMKASMRILGNEHPDTLISINNLASTYWNQGRWNEAEKLDVQVMETRKRVLGDEHPDTLTSIANLASTYLIQRRWENAAMLGFQVMETRRKVLGDKHPDTLVSMNNFAFTLSGQGSLSRAISLMEDCCKLRADVLGPQHPDTVSSREALEIWRRDDTGLDK